MTRIRRPIWASVPFILLVVSFIVWMTWTPEWGYGANTACTMWLIDMGINSTVAYQLDPCTYWPRHLFVLFLSIFIVYAIRRFVSGSRNSSGADT